MRKLTEGNISKQIVLFALPILIGVSLQRIYVLVDTMMVGRLLGAKELSAVGAASSISIMFIELCNSLTSGFSIIIAQFFGAEDDKNLKKALAGTYVLSAIFGVLFTVIGFVLINPLLTWTKVPLELFDESSVYLKVLILGLIASLIYNLMANLLRSVGDSTMPLVFLIISVVLNIFLDYFFIATIHKGVMGAAIATVISQAVAGLSCVVFCIFKRKLLSVSFKDFIVDISVYKLLLSQGFAMALMLSIVSVSTVILQTGINSLGTELIAGYTAGRKYLELLMMPGASLAMTAASYSSQNFGAKKFDRIEEGVNKMYIIGFIWSFIATIIVFILGKFMITTITGNNVSDEIINNGVLYLRISILLFCPLMVLSITRSTLQGMNHKKTPLISSSIEFLVKILAVVFFVPKLGFLGVCITEPLIWVLGALCIYPLYKNLFKKSKTEYLKQSMQC